MFSFLRRTKVKHTKAGEFAEYREGIRISNGAQRFVLAQTHTDPPILVKGAGIVCGSLSVFQPPIAWGNPNVRVVIPASLGYVNNVDLDFQRVANSTGVINDGD